MDSGDSGNGSTTTPCVLFFSKHFGHFKTGWWLTYPSEQYESQLG